MERGTLRLLAAATSAALVLPACAGSEDEPDSVATATTTVTSTLSVTVGEPPLTSRAFQMPSKNIGCLLSHRLLRCDILSGLEPQPSETCDFDWVGLELGVTGAALPNCGSDTVFDAGAPTFAYGSTWARSGIVCESRRSGLQCSNRDGHEFTLARGSWTAS